MLLYLIKLSICLSVSWLFYQLLLRRLTFYTLNRWYLLGYSLLSFIIPLIDIGRLLEKDDLQGAPVISYIPVIGDYKNAAPPAVPGYLSAAGVVNIFLWVLLSGSLVLVVRLVVRWLSLRQIRGRARLINDSGGNAGGDGESDVLGDAGVKIFQVDEPIIPFSFGNAIYINRQLHTESEYSAIILHEYVHIRQRHTVDILLAELLCITSWYNPFAWLIRYSIRQNLEFIADRKVLEKGFDKKGYQYHLLQVMGSPRYRLANNFNFSSLKKRIIMMNKIKSASTQLVKFLFIVPLLAVLLLAFREKISSARAGRLPAAAAEVNDTSQKPLSAPDSESFSIVHPSASTKDVTFKKVLSPVDTSGPLRDPLYFKDGVEISANDEMSLTPANIESINVLKGDSAVRKYGERGRKGVVVITTRKSNLPLPPGRMPSNKDKLATVVIRNLSDTAAQPLYILDGVEITPQQMRVLDPSDIESINVIKGESAVAIYGEKGLKGVILIVTKSTKTTAADGGAAPGPDAAKGRQKMIVETRKGMLITVRADTIEGPFGKDLGKMVYFLNGMKLEAGTPVQSIVDRKDIYLVENTDRPAILRKYGEPGGKILMNIVTKENKDNPNAYILDYQHPEDPRRTP